MGFNMQVWTSEETLGLYLEITYMYMVIVESMASFGGIEMKGWE